MVFRLNRYISTNHSIDQSASIGPQLYGPQIYGPQIYQIRKQGTVEFGYPPDDRASVVVIARQLPLFQQSIREAIICMQGKGLLNSLQQLGTFLQNIYIASALASTVIARLLRADISIANSSTRGF